MKNIKKLQWMFIGLLLLGLPSCSSDDEDTGNFEVGNAVEFGSSIVKRTEISRATSEAWESGDEVGVYMVKNGTTLVLHDARNVKYTAGTDGKLSAAGEAIHYPLDEKTGVDFIGYYPYRDALDNYTYNVDLRDQSQPSKIDLLYSNNALNVRDENTPVNLEFSHRLTKLVFKITAGQGLSESSLNNMKVSLSGLHIVADFNLATAQMNNARGNETVTALTAADGKQSQAIVLPAGNVSFGLDFELTNGALFEWKGTPVTLQEGKIHSYNVVVGTSKIEVSEGEITDWLGIDDDPTTGVSKPVVVTTYAVGDVYPKEGTPLGIVYEISNGGKNGKVVSLKEKQARWGDNTKDESADGVELIREADQGKQATINLVTKRHSANNFQSDYAIFHWLYSEMNGNEIDGQWYIPSKNELKSLYAGISGVAYAEIETAWTDGNAMPNFDAVACQNARTAFNNAVKAAGGTEFNFYGQYWAVTEIGANPVWSVHFQTSVLQTGKSKGDSYGRARAILAF